MIPHDKNQDGAPIAASPDAAIKAAESARLCVYRGSMPPDRLSAIAQLEALTLHDEATLWGAAGLAQTLERPEATLTLIEDRGSVLAYCLSTCIAGECEILQIATHPQHQRRGLGRMLLTAVMTAVQEQGCDRVVLEVRRGNLSARRLYEQLGFQLDGVRRGYYGGSAADQDALLLSCPLRTTIAPPASAPCIAR